MVPKQRKAGQFGGDGHRSNRGAFRASGGNVKPPSKSCCLPTLVGLAAIPAGVYTLVSHIIIHV